MAVTANQLIKKQDGCLQSYPVAASTHIYQGTLVFINSTGYADDDTASGANRFAGVAKFEVDNSSGANGDLTVEVNETGEYELTVSSMTQAKVSTDAYATDNYTVVSGYSANGVKIGKLNGYVSSTKGIVAIEPGNQKQGAVIALGAAMKLAKGSAAALDGSNPTPISTGLATITSASVTLRGTAAPGDNTSVLTCDYSGSDGTLNVYAWKNTGGTDPTLVASTGTETFDWIAIGT
jgi:hypothetical protein